MLTQNVVRVLGATFAVAGLLVASSTLALPQVRAVFFSVRPFFGAADASRPIGPEVQFSGDTALYVIGGLLFAVGSTILLFTSRTKQRITG